MVYSARKRGQKCRVCGRASEQFEEANEYTHKLTILFRLAYISIAVSFHRICVRPNERTSKQANNHIRLLLCAKLSLWFGFDVCVRIVCVSVQTNNATFVYTHTRSDTHTCCITSSLFQFHSTHLLYLFFCATEMYVSLRCTHSMCIPNVYK